MTRFRLMPRDERFFELLEQNAQIALDAARVLQEVLEEFQDVEPKVRKLKDLEHAGDEVTHSIFTALDRSFVTPFDREDIARLASDIDDVIDGIEEAGLHLHVYKVEAPTELARRFGRVLVDQTACIQRAMPMLRDLKRHQEIRTEIVELHRLENEGDDYMVEALGTLYEGATDVPALVRAIQWGDVYKVLEAATDECEHVGSALESIIVKHA